MAEVRWGRVCVCVWGGNWKQMEGANPRNILFLFFWVSRAEFAVFFYLKIFVLFNFFFFIFYILETNVTLNILTLLKAVVKSHALKDKC